MRSINKNVFFIVCAFLYLYTIVAYTLWEQLALYSLVPAAFLISILLMRAKFNIYMQLLFALYAWILCSYPFAAYKELAETQLHQILGCLLFTIPVYNLCFNLKRIYWIYGIWLVFYIVCARYAMDNIMLVSLDVTEERLSQENGGFDGNHFAQYTVYLTFVLYLFGEICENKKYKRYLEASFWLIIPITFYVSIITASRQMLIIGVPLILSLLYIRYLKGERIGKKVNFALIVLILGCIFYSKFAPTYQNSYLAERNKANVEEDTRLILLKNSFEVGLENPILGVGPGNFCKYSFNGYNAAHNSYGEIFANSGFPALFFYVAILWIFINRQRKRYKQSKDKRYLMFLIFGFFYALDNMFMSFHTSPRLISFLIVLATHSELYFQRQKEIALMNRLI